MDKRDLKIIASFYASPMFPVLKKMIEERIRIIQATKNKRDNEFDTIYQLGKSDGREEELVELLKTLENYYKRCSNE